MTQDKAQDKAEDYAERLRTSHMAQSKKRTTGRQAGSKAFNPAPINLTAEDIRRGGDERVKSVEVPGITKDGRPGTIHYLPLPTGVVIDFADEDLPDHERFRATARAISQCLVDPDGEPLFDEEGVRDIPIDTLSDIITAITSGTSGGAEGKG